MTEELLAVAATIGVLAIIVSALKWQCRQTVDRSIH